MNVNAEVCSYRYDLRYIMFPWNLSLICSFILTTGTIGHRPLVGWATWDEISWYLPSELGICDILVRIRMRILGSVPLTNGSGCGPGMPKTYGSYRFRSRWGSGTLVKVIRKSQNRRNQVFSYYYCSMMEGSGAGSGARSVLVTNGSGCGSGRPKTLRIRIPNTTSHVFLYHHTWSRDGGGRVGRGGGFSEGGARRSVLGIK